MVAVPAPRGTTAVTMSMSMLVPMTVAVAVAASWHSTHNLEPP